MRHRGALEESTPPTPLHCFFSAAYDGCLMCVHAALARGDVELADVSGSGAYNVLDWAELGEAEGNDTSELQMFLRARGLPATTETPGLCGRAHAPVGFKKQTGQACDLFAAAYAGCLQCVKFYVEEVGVKVDMWTESGRPTAMAWAIYGEEMGKSTKKVREYLEGRGVAAAAGTHQGPGSECHPSAQ
jgi:hypothetical protein